MINFRKKNYKNNQTTFKVFFSIIILLIFIIPTIAIDFKQNIQNMTNKFNGVNDDFSPTVTKDGRILLYNAKSVSGKDNDIYISRYSNGSWSSPKPFSILNSKDNDESPYITPDGKMVVFSSDRVGSKRPSVTANNRDRITYDLYISYNIHGTWTTPRNIKGTVNTIFNERSPSLSIDKKTLYFTRWPYKRLKAAKIYKSELASSSYINVTPLPFPINANQYEITLTPAQKQRGFYFSSRRAGGYGGWDIYFVEYVDGKFGNPENLGPKINSSADELTFTDAGFFGYLSSNRLGSYGKFDIYSVKIPKARRKPYYGDNKKTKKITSPTNTKKPNKPKIKNKITKLKEKNKTRLRFLITSNNKEVVAEFKINLKNIFIDKKKKTQKYIVRKTIRRSDKNGFFQVIPKKDITLVEVICNDNRYKKLKQEYIVKKNLTSTYKIDLTSYIKVIKSNPKTKKIIEKKEAIAKTNTKKETKKITPIKKKKAQPTKITKKITPVKSTVKKDKVLISKKETKEAKKITSIKKQPQIINTDKPKDINKTVHKKYKYKIITLYFRKGSTKIEISHYPELHSIIDRLRHQKDLRVKITGYSAYNKNEKITEAVKSYLINYGINKSKIAIAQPKVKKVSSKRLARRVLIKYIK